MNKQKYNKKGSILEKISWWRKLVCKIAADTLAKYGCESWQCSGKKNWDFNNRQEADIQVPTSQFVHWLLRCAGLQVCVMDVLEKYPNLMKQEGDPRKRTNVGK